MNYDEEAEKKVEEVEAIYRGAIARLAALKEEQLKIVEDFLGTIKDARLKELRERVTGSKSD